MNSFQVCGTFLCMALLVSVPAVASQDAGAGPAGGAAPETKMILNRPMSRAEHAMLNMVLEMADAVRTMAARTERKWEELPDYSPLPLPRDVSDQEVAAAIEASRTFFLESRLDSLSVQADLSSIPNSWLTDVQVKWEELRDEQGRLVPLQPPSASPALLSITSPSMGDSGIWRTDLRLMEGVKPPDTLEGWKGAATATFRVPARFRVVSFKPSEVGITRDGVTMVKWQRGRVVVMDKKGRLGLEGAGVRGISANGLVLESHGVVDDRTEFELLRKLARTSWEEIPSVVPVPEERSVQLTYRFSGEPSRVEVYFIERWSVHEVGLRLLPAPGGSFFTSRYLSGMRGSPCELTAQALAKQVRVFASRWSSESSESFGKPMVVVQLPPCLNSAWAQVKFDSLKYRHTSGRSIASVKTTSHYRDESFAWVLGLAAPEGRAGAQPDITFRELAQVKGRAQLAFPRVRVLSLSRERPGAEGALLFYQDRTVILRLSSPLSDKLPAADENEWTSWFIEGPRNPIAGYDAAGRRLRPLQFQRQSGDGTTVLTVSFAEAPERVDLTLQGEQVRLTLPFNVKLPPAPKPPVQSE
jgi:hypothetical protein